MDFMAKRPFKHDATYTPDNRQINKYITDEAYGIIKKSRETFENNPYFKGMLTLVPSQVVGDTLSLNPNAANFGVADKLLNAAVSDAFKKRLDKLNPDGDFLDLARKFTMQELMDGENIYIEESDGTLSCVDPLYVLHNLNKKKGTQFNEMTLEGTIKNGIEFDDNEKPVAVWIADRVQQQSEFEAMLEILPLNTAKATRYEISEIRWSRITSYAGQLRGLPCVSSALPAAHNLQQIEAHLSTAVRFAAQNNKMFETPFGDTDNKKSPEYIDSKEGSMIILPTGMKAVSGFDMDFPDDTYKQLHESLINQLATCFGVSVATFTRDLSKNNFSSNKAGFLLERETWRAAQMRIYKTLVLKTYFDWLPTALRNGEIRTITGKLFPRNTLDRLQNPKPVFRSYQSAQPDKDSADAEKRINLGIATRKEVIENNGGNYEDTLAQRLIEATDEAKLAAITGEKSI